MCSILDVLPELPGSLHLQPESAPSTDLVRNLDPDDRSVDSFIKYALMQLYDDPAIKTAIKLAHLFQLNNNATYFFDNLDRIMSPHFVPTDADVLQARVKTTGVRPLIPLSVVRFGPDFPAFGGVICQITETRFEIGKNQYRVIGE